MATTDIANNGDGFLRAGNWPDGLTLELLGAGYQWIGSIALSADAEARLLNLLIERRDQAAIDKIREEARQQLLEELAPVVRDRLPGWPDPDARPRY